MKMDRCTLVAALFFSLISIAPANAAAGLKLHVKPSTLSFGKVQAGTLSAAGDVMLSNRGRAVLDIDSVSKFGPFIVTLNTCGVNLGPRAECHISVVFAPIVASNPAGTKETGELVIVNSGQRGVLNVKLTGTAFGEAPTPTATTTATATPTATGVTPTATAAPTPTVGPTPTASPTDVLEISSLVPSSGVLGGPAFTLMINGSNFSPSSVVSWNGNPRSTTFVSDTELQANISASDIDHVGTVLVSVDSPPYISNPATFFIGTSGGPGFAELVINQQANDLVYDPVNQVIYLSVDGSAPTRGNTISVIDLASGSISSSKFAGSNPDVLTISDDSQFLYAGIDGAASVQRFTLPDLGADIKYSLGSDSFFGPYFALDLQAAPGFPHTTAVTLGNFGVSPAAEGGIVIYDDATARPTKTRGFGGTGWLFDSVQWGADATALYAANSEDTGFDFYTLSVNSSGVTLDNDYGSAFSSFSNRIHFDKGTGLVYSDDGHVIDPSTGNPVGIFDFGAFGVMVPDSTLNMAFFIAGGTIESYDLREFSFINSITIPGVSGTPLRIIRWGQNGLAFNTDGGSVYLIGGNFVH